MPQRKHRPLPQFSADDVKRFWSKVDKRSRNACWPWTAGTWADPPNNYGCFGLNSRNTMIASRAAFFLAHGIDPGESIVCHSCDNPLCCNPKHLSLGSYLDNGRERRERGRTNKFGERYVKIIREITPRHRTNGMVPALPTDRIPHVTYRGLPILNEKGVRRFWSKVDRSSPDQCWNWKAHVSVKGYGRFRVMYRNFQAHRIAYLLSTGTDPGKGLICHACDNRRCCNPKHLSIGTALDNQRQKWERNPPDVSGENSNRAILTWKDVREIREKYATGRYFMRELGEEYGVSIGCITAIVHHINWRQTPIDRADGCQ